jgi:carbamoyltransferase
MGLAPYGKFNKEVYELLRTFMVVKDCRLIALRRAFDITPALKALVKDWPGDDSLKYADLAFTGQFFFSEILSELLENLYRFGISDNLVLTGGCALNSAYNGKVQELTSFKNLHVPCAPADDGNAVGAALLAYYEDNPGAKEVTGVRSPYLGSRMSSDAVERIRRFNKFNSAVTSENICNATAELIAQGKIIGWVQGKAEYGPRSLGNRSILADPRNENIKDIINSRVKFREEFRPFAPSILHEHGHEYFENYSESLYMEKALRFKQECVHKVPGVVHVDGTGRLQTVKKEYNERYYNLISAFKEITGVPIVLNTSFNIMGKPIVHSVEDAVAMFCTTGIDILVINDELIML